MGSVIDILHDKEAPSTTPSNISVEFPSAIWRPCNILPSVLSERTPRRSPKGVVTTRSQSPSAVISAGFPMAFEERSASVIPVRSLQLPDTSGRYTGGSDDQTVSHISRAHEAHL